MPKKTKQKETNIKVNSEDEARIDKFLADRYPDYSRTFFKRLINQRLVQVDAHPVSPHHALQSGQQVTIDWPKKEVFDPGKVIHIPFPILYEDDDLLVINKPPQLLCHPTGWKKNGDTLVEMLSPKISGTDWPDDMRPGLIHRLDKDTSGVLVFAKTPDAHAKISKQFASRMVRKTYQALVKGIVKDEEGKLECYLTRDTRFRQRFKVAAMGRQAITEFKIHEKIGGISTWLDIHPLTGRTHQIRVQLSAYGHPVLGDAIYGGMDKRFQFVKRQMLHASTLEFTHPETGKKVKFEAPLPKDFMEAIKLIRLQAS